jgi:hypothetical protein
MATRSTSIFLEETGLGTALNQALQTCPEVLSSLYTTHYHHVLQVCRRFAVGSFGSRKTLRTPRQKSS